MSNDIFNIYIGNRINKYYIIIFNFSLFFLIDFNISRFFLFFSISFPNNDNTYKSGKLSTKDSNLSISLI